MTHRTFATGAIASLMLCFGATAIAAQPDPTALEPAVDTSATPRPSPAPAAPAPAATPAPTNTPAKPASPPPANAAPRAQSPAAAPRANQAAPSPPTGGRARDRLELEATQITGNRELPRVMYVVPWKKSDLGDLGGRPANSLLDEVLAPVDREVFLRQNRYYDALKPDAKEAAGAAPAN
jgi:hypothetical protein